MLFKVKVDGFVVDFKVGNFDGDFFELLVFLGVFWLFYNCKSSVVEFIIVVVVEDQFRLEVGFFVSMDYFGQVYFVLEEFEVFY